MSHVVPLKLHWLGSSELLAHISLSTFIFQFFPNASKEGDSGECLVQVERLIVRSDVKIW